MQNKIDTLNRTLFVEQAFNLTETISANNGNTAFAINGEWGCGKSFVLDMIEEKLRNTQREDSDENKYFVIKYNCWQYDFYEEPLIAFVSAIINLIKESNGLFAEEKTQNKILNGLKKVGAGLLNIGNVIIKNTVGVDIKSIIDPLTTVTKDARASIEENNDTMSYDNFYTFRNKLNELRDILSEISRTQTIVIIVDELDRCSPEYAIKVLERLHHVTDGLNNTVTIIATDKSKLQNTVSKIYGFESKDANNYLKKFINFEIFLDNGINDNNILNKYIDYINQFKHSVLDCDLTDFISTLFYGISAREQEQLFEKASLIHRLICNRPMDYTVFCVELTLVVLNNYYKIPNILNGIRTRYLTNPFGIDFSKSSLGEFQNRISTAVYGQQSNIRRNDFSEYLFYVTAQTSIYGMILWYLNAILPDAQDYSNIILIHPNTAFHVFGPHNLPYIRNFAEALKLIQ